MIMHALLAYITETAVSYFLITLWHKLISNFKNKLQTVILKKQDSSAVSKQVVLNDSAKNVLPSGVTRIKQPDSSSTTVAVCTICAIWLINEPN